MTGEDLGLSQQAFADEDAFQCGYCTPGQIMAAEGLLRANPSPSLDDIRHGMAGNICRCGAYAHIFKAVEKAAETEARPGGHPCTPMSGTTGRARRPRRRNPRRRPSPGLRPG